jgi:hypothetical protein
MVLQLVKYMIKLLILQSDAEVQRLLTSLPFPSSVRKGTNLEGDLKIG